MPNSHNVTLYRSQRESWAVCSCGWTSALYVLQAGAQWAFGAHLTTVARQRYGDHDLIDKEDS